MWRRLICGCSLSAMAACSSGGNEGLLTITDPGTRTRIVPTGSFQSELSNPDLAIVSLGATSALPALASVGGLSSSTASGLVEYALGVDAARQEVSGIASIRSSNVGAPVTTGTATYRTAYSYNAIDEIGTDNITVPPLALNAQGQAVRTGATGFGLALSSTPFQTVDLAADFDAGTLTGGNSEISVAGQVSGAALGGSVTATPRAGTSISADLQGQIGSDGLVGAFAGRDADSVVVGGLVGQRQ